MAPLITEADLKKRLATLPRLHLGALPTPLDEVPRLSESLAGPHLLIKRDDLTGVAFGGNKIREFEYSLAPAVEQKCDVLMYSGAAQSNQARQTAAVANHLGLRTVIVASKDAHSEPVQANLLICRLLGAQIHMVNPETQEQELGSIKEQLRAEGHRPYDTASDGAVYRSIGYVDGFLELCDQLDDRGIRMDALYLCSGAHAHVGLAVAAKALGVDVRIVGIRFRTVGSDTAHAARLASNANEAAERLDLQLSFGPHDFECYVDFAGPFYGVVTASGQEAIQLAARTEGLILDPVYTGKAMAGLMAHIREGQLVRHQNVVFWHTGGTPGIFAYSEELGVDL